MRVLLTGGNGYIGKAAELKLKADGADVRVFDGPGRGQNIVEAGNVNSVFEEFKPEAVVHLAALPDIRQSERMPLQYWRANGLGTANIIRAAEKTESVRTIVLGSSLCVKAGGLSHYKLTKLAGESMLAAALEESGRRTRPDLRGFALRIGNAAGGVTPAAETAAAGRMIPTVVRCLKHGLRMNINGNPETVMRDFVHVDDVAAAIVHAVNWNLATGVELSGSVEIADIGRGVAVTLKSVIEVAERIAGENLNLLIGEQTAGEPEVTIADLSAHNWKPAADFEAIVQSVWDYWDQETPGVDGWKCETCGAMFYEETPPHKCSVCQENGPWVWNGSQRTG